jgi:hypothetical protein
MRLASPKFLTILSLVLLLALFLAGCQSEEETNLYPLDKMPADVQAAPASVQHAYQFAAANPDLMQHIPCYCGCGSIGHTSNYACYVKGVDASGEIQFDNHALGCSICVDITLDTMRLLDEGKSAMDIKDYVDQTYSKYGPSNIPSQ